MPPPRRHLPPRCGDCCERGVLVTVVHSGGAGVISGVAGAITGGVFPGGTAVTDLCVYDAEAADGCRGGSPHLHTASTEGYVVIGGAGALQTLSGEGFAEQPLTVGDVVWFTPGTVHRLINGGELRLVVVMSNAGLPESGDAVLTFPPEILSDPDAYAAAAALPGAGASDAEREAAAYARRDLALTGFAQLRVGGASALASFQEQAALLVQPRVAAWRTLWEGTVAAETERTRQQLDALAAGRPGLMSSAHLTRAEPTGDVRGFGMCGRLRTWRWPTA